MNLKKSGKVNNYRVVLETKTIEELWKSVDWMKNKVREEVI